MYDLNPILTQLNKDIRDGKWSPNGSGNRGIVDVPNDTEDGTVVNDNEPTFWDDLNQDEKAAMLFALANTEGINLFHNPDFNEKETIQAHIEKATDEFFKNELTKSITVVSTIQDECNHCGADLPVTVVAQLDVSGSETKVTEETLPRLVCSDCEA